MNPDRACRLNDLHLRYENMYNTMLCERATCKFLALFFCEYQIERVMKVSIATEDQL